MHVEVPSYCPTPKRCPGPSAGPPRTGPDGLLPMPSPVTARSTGDHSRGGKGTPNDSLRHLDRRRASAFGLWIATHPRLFRFGAWASQARDCGGVWPKGASTPSHVCLLMIRQVSGVLSICWRPRPDFISAVRISLSRTRGYSPSRSISGILSGFVVDVIQPQVRVLAMTGGLAPTMGARFASYRGATARGRDVAM